MQISPTLQATKSNCLTLHEGNYPPYLNYFLNPKSEDIIVDNLHSELGSKFLKKRNRNLIVNTSQEVEVFENFKWITLKQLKQLAVLDNMLNIDSRSVLATLNFSPNSYYGSKASKIANDKFNYTNSLFLKSFIDQDNDYLDLNSIINSITKEKFSTNISKKKIKLSEMRLWELSKKLIKHKNNL